MEVADLLTRAAWEFEQGAYLQALNDYLEAGINAARLEKLWSRRVGIGSVKVCAGDVNGDGRMEIIACAMTSPSEMVISAMDAQGNPIWQLSTREARGEPPINLVPNLEVTIETEYVSVKDGAGNSRRYDTGPVEAAWVVDVAGHAELMALWSTTGRLQVFDLDSGVYRWNYPPRAFAESLCIADVSGDGQGEILVAARDGNVYVVDGRGSLRWRYQGNDWLRSIHAADADGDGHMEIIAGFSNKPGTLCVLSSEGHLKATWKSQNVAIRTICFGDLDGDGHGEILAGLENDEICILKMGGRQRLELVQRWKLGNAGIRSAHAMDIDGDGREEVVVSTVDGQVCLLEGTGQLRWRCKVTPGEPSDLCCLVELPQQRRYAIVRLNPDGDVYAWDANGDLRYALCLERVSVESLYLDDVNGDSRLEMLLGTTDGYLHMYGLDLERVGIAVDRIRDIYDHLGPIVPITLLPSSRRLLEAVLGLGPDQTLELGGTTNGRWLESGRQSIRQGQYQQALASLLRVEGLLPLWTGRTEGKVRGIELADIDRDGQVEILAGSEDRHLYVFAADGTLRWRFEAGAWAYSVCTADVDGDGRREVILSSWDGHLNLLDAAGELRWRRPLARGFLGAVCVADVDEDGKPEIIVGGWDEGQVFIVDTDGALKAKYRVGNLHRSVLAADVDEDGRVELILASGDGYVSALGLSGDLKWQYATTVDVSSLWLADVDGDGHREIIAGSQHGHINVLDGGGVLKWRFIAGSGWIKSVAAADLDGDGRMEVLAGSTDHYAYVFNRQGDLLWRFRTPDEARALQIADLDGDGQLEVVTGSAGGNVYVFRVVNPQEKASLIEEIWAALAVDEGEMALVQRLLSDSDERLRAHALLRLARSDSAAQADPAQLETLLRDESSWVRHTFAQVLPDLLARGVHDVNGYFTALVSDREPEVRMMVARGLPEIAAQDLDLAFGAFARLATDFDRGVGREALRRLGEVAVEHPERTWPLLLSASHVADYWLRHEAARSLADYLDAHSEGLFKAAHGLFEDGCPAEVIGFLAQLPHDERVRDVFRVYHRLMNSEAEQVGEVLTEAVAAFQRASELPHGTEMADLYAALQQLHAASSVNDIVHIVTGLGTSPAPAGTLNPHAWSCLSDLIHVVDILGTYLARDALGDRLSYLLDAVNALEGLQRDVVTRLVADKAGRHPLPERAVFQAVLSRWRELVRRELARLRGRSDLRPEIKTRLLPATEEATVALQIRNCGKAPAENVVIHLEGGATECLDYISSQETNTVEFTLAHEGDAPVALRLAFEITYDDAEARGQRLEFADQVQFLAPVHDFRPIPNPYVTGKPVRDPRMFFGRQDLIEFIRVNLMGERQDQVLVLYGQRRTGKTSVLLHVLDTDLLHPRLPVYVDMQGIGRDTFSILYGMAREIFGRLRKLGHDPTEPVAADFRGDPFFALDGYLDGLGDRTDRGLVLLIDEFDALEPKIASGVITPDLLPYLRHLMQHRQNLSFILAGAEGLQGMLREYESALFNIALHREISFLDEAAARRLIVEPVEGYLRVDEYAVERILDLTAGHPYFTQLLCHALVNHCNQVRRDYATVSELAAVLDRARTTWEGHVEFGWQTLTPAEQAVLAAVAQLGGSEGRSVGLGEVEQHCRDRGLPFDRLTLQEAREQLVERSLLRVMGDRCEVTIGLVRMWLKDKQIGQSG